VGAGVGGSVATVGVVAGVDGAALSTAALGVGVADDTAEPTAVGFEPQAVARSAAATTTQADRGALRALVGIFDAPAVVGLN
jgi:hypothetical protein